YNYTHTPPFSIQSLNHCCTTPLPSRGTGNFTNEPLFVGLIAGDYHLQSNSPCINSGRNSQAPGQFDFDLAPRIVGANVDVGAFEFQSPESTLPYAWLQQYGLPTDGSVDYIDSDSDGMNNWQESLAGTSPIDSASALRLLPPAVNASNIVVSWQ